MARFCNAGNSGELTVFNQRAPARVFRGARCARTHQPVTTVVLSHEHYDYVGGTEVFPDADVVCHRSCQAVFALDVPGTAPDKVDVAFGDFLSLDVGGKTVHLHNYGPADGFASTVVFLPAERIAFTADVYASRQLTLCRRLARPRRGRRGHRGRDGGRWLSRSARTTSATR